MMKNMQHYNITHKHVFFWSQACINTGTQ